MVPTSVNVIAEEVSRLVDRWYLHRVYECGGSRLLLY